MNIGIVGGGQLARMLALAATPLDHRIVVVEPRPDCAASPVCAVIQGDYDDRQALSELARRCDVITWEFENVPLGTARWLAERLPIRPGVEALRVSQERLVEKRTFVELGMDTAPFAPIDAGSQVRAALEAVGLPAVVKTRRMGYDGKGQRIVRTWEEAETVYADLGGVPLLAEGFVDFDRELSLVACRGLSGDIVTWPLVENDHDHGILRKTTAPAPQVSPALQARAHAHAETLLGALDYVGVLCIEFFAEGEHLRANEFAPRVHNSGHWSSDGAVTSQFANHVRAVTGMPLGDPSPRGHSVLHNLIGPRPDFEPLLRIPGCHVHWYGKSPRPGRKVGHVTVCGDRPDEVASRARQAAAHIDGAL